MKTVNSPAEELPPVRVGLQVLRPAREKGKRRS